MDQPSADTARRPPKRVLALDGGGVRGLTTLLILKRLMYLIRPNEDDYKLPKPCEYFDLIAGTSTGGLIAIMLGRLKMDVQTCIDRYRQLAKDVFVPRRRTLIGGHVLHNILGGATFEATRLSSSVKDLLASIEPRLPESAPLLVESPSSCKIFVCTTMENSRPLRLRSYTINSEESVRCTIVEAARATSAAPTFFDPIKFKNVGVTLRDGAFRANNPIQELISEIESEFSDWRITCVVSIGTGVQADEKFGKSLVAIAKSCSKIATDTEEAHLLFKERECKLDGRFRGKYFRFNVSQGLQGVGLEEWKEMDMMWAKTYAYMRDIREELGNCVNCLREGVSEPSGEIELGAETGVAEAPSQGHALNELGDDASTRPAEGNPEGSSSANCAPDFSLATYKFRNFLHASDNEPISNLDSVGPNPVNFFVKRNELIEKVVEVFDSPPKVNPTTCCLVGIGSAGKTQFALHFAKSMFPRQYSTLLWFDAKSKGALIESFLFTARLLDLVPSFTSSPNDENYNTMSRRWEIDYVVNIKKWISQRKGQWLMVFDNADEKSMLEDLSRFFPATSGGHILITSRREEAYLLGTPVYVQGLSPGSARELFLHHVGLTEPSEEELKTSEKIIEHMGYLALAIDLAGGFIRTRLGRDITQYMQLYATSKDTVLEKCLQQNLNASGSGYPFSVFTAWGVSLAGMGHSAKSLIQLLSFFDPSYINLDLFRRACATRSRWTVLGELADVSPAEGGVPEWLIRAVTTAHGDWDEFSFLEMINEICSFSFANLVTVEGPSVYQYDHSRLFDLKQSHTKQLLTIHPLLHEIGRLYLDKETQDQYATDAECILWHSVDDDASKTLRSLNQPYRPVLYLANGATSDAILLVSRLDEVFRHLRIRFVDVFGKRFTIPEIGRFESVYLCFIAAYFLRSAHAQMLSRLDSMANISYFEGELRKMAMLRRQDMTMQWLRLASRSGELWANKLRFHFVFNDGELWQTAADCELQLYQDSLKVVRKALTERSAEEEEKGRDVPSLRANIAAIQGSLLHSQNALGEQNLTFEKFGVAS